MVETVDIDLGGRIITLETGKMAKQANGAVVVRSGDSVVLVTACMAEEPKPGAAFFPLTVDYREYTYAAGKIPGGFIKREGPSHRKRNSHQPADRPAHPPPVPRRFHARNPGDRHGAFGRPRARSRTRWPSSAPPRRWPSPTFRSTHVLGGVRVGLVDGAVRRQPDLRGRPRVQAEHRGGRHRRRHRDGGSRRERRFPKRRCWTPSISATSAARRSSPPSANWSRKAGKPKRAFDIARARPGALRPDLERKYRDELADALDTEKYPKLESYAAVHDAQEARGLEALPEEEQRGEAGKLLRRPQGAHLPRRDARKPAPSRWPRVRPDPARSPSRPASCRAPTAPRCSPAARRRRWSPSRWAPRTTSSASSCWSRARPPSASCCTTTSRRSAWARSASCAAPAGARSATAPWPSAPSRR